MSNSSVLIASPTLLYSHTTQRKARRHAHTCNARKRLVQAASAGQFQQLRVNEPQISDSMSLLRSTILYLLTGVCNRDKTAVVWVSRRWHRTSLEVCLCHRLCVLDADQPRVGAGFRVICEALHDLTVFGGHGDGRGVQRVSSGQVTLSTCD
jgi:hypothetical protein